MNREPRRAAILLMAGSGKRMGGACSDKTLVKIKGWPVFLYSLLTLDGTGAFGDIVIVVRDPEQQKNAEKYVGKFELHAAVSYVFGGNLRQNSVLNALLHLEQKHPEFVLIHDSARPLITEDGVRQLLCAAEDCDGAVIAHGATDTLLSFAEGKRKYLPRSEVWHVETPQIFKYDLILDGYVKATGTLADDSSALGADADIKIVENAHPNIKITRPEDIFIVKSLLNKKLVQ
jgi:2-C-methyl-D-erythritol 4-phosphate cytidylyltransferase